LNLSAADFIYPHSRSLHFSYSRFIVQTKRAIIITLYPIEYLKKIIKNPGALVERQGFGRLTMPSGRWLTNLLFHRIFVKPEAESKAITKFQIANFKHFHSMMLQSFCGHPGFIIKYFQDGQNAGAENR
jgi:hypothetical protein